MAKYNPSGFVLYSTYLGGPGGENSGAIAIDLAGNAYVTGNNYEGGFPLKDPLQTDGHVGSFEGFVSKLSPDGSNLLYSTYLGGYGNEHGLGIAVDLLGAVYVAGFSGSEDFPTTPGAFQTTTTATTMDSSSRSPRQAPAKSPAGARSMSLAALVPSASLCSARQSSRRYRATCSTSTMRPGRKCTAFVERIHDRRLNRDVRRNLRQRRSAVHIYRNRDRHRRTRRQ